MWRGAVTLLVVLTYTYSALLPPDTTFSQSIRDLLRFNGQDVGGFQKLRISRITQSAKALH